MRNGFGRFPRLRVGLVSQGYDQAQRRSFTPTQFPPEPFESQDDATCVTKTFRTYDKCHARLDQFGDLR